MQKTCQHHLSDSFPSVKMLHGCSGGCIQEKNCSWKEVFKHRFQKQCSARTLKRLSVYHKMLWLSLKGCLLPVFFLKKSSWCISAFSGITRDLIEVEVSSSFHTKADFFLVTYIEMIKSSYLE